ncbi:hypothetical protein F2Q69_00016529 [Brassica cretica]|uniref:Uncharacterized protein n=1 Tax=Brassica cretica TaxID=69181 RepID=A0A8S9R2D1_BRACR|nr:hypothetical protein F2Q69_00016529 [Brassica cretica]
MSKLSLTYFSTQSVWNVPGRTSGENPPAFVTGEPPPFLPPDPPDPATPLSPVEFLTLTDSISKTASSGSFRRGFCKDSKRLSTASPSSEKKQTTTTISETIPMEIEQQHPTLSTTVTVPDPRSENTTVTTDTSPTQDYSILPPKTTSPIQNNKALTNKTPPPALLFKSPKPTTHTHDSITSGQMNAPSQKQTLTGFTPAKPQRKNQKTQKNQTGFTPTKAHPLRTGFIPAKPQRKKQKTQKKYQPVITQTDPILPSCSNRFDPFNLVPDPPAVNSSTPSLPLHSPKSLSNTNPFSTPDPIHRPSLKRSRSSPILSPPTSSTANPFYALQNTLLTSTEISLPCIPNYTPPTQTVSTSNQNFFSFGFLGAPPSEAPLNPSQ